jgi:hypothetical protein
MVRRNNRNSRRLLNKRARPRNGAMLDVQHQIADNTQAAAAVSMPRVRDAQLMRAPRNKCYLFERSIQGPTIVNATAPLDTFGALSYRLSDFTDYTEFTLLFDQYRILQFQFVFTPTSNNNYAGTLATVIDLNDGTVPVLMNALYQYPTLMLSRPGQLVTRTFQPQVALAAYSGAFTSYANRGAQWIDSQSPSVFHYGLKYGITGISGQPSTAQYVVITRAVIQCRNVK